MGKIGTLSIIIMNKQLFLYVLLVHAAALNGQFYFDRPTISCMAVSACDEICINSTAGQVDFGTMSNNQNIFTAGFEQNNGDPALYLEVSVFKDLCSGLYQVSVVNTYGCSSADTVSYFWNDLPGQSTVALSSAQNILRATTNTGCTFERSFDFETMQVIAKPCGIEFHNFCSPNGDGDNDLWTIGNITASEFAQNEVRIQNRWGGEVWSVTNYDNIDKAWDGTDMRGRPLPDGTYFFVVRLRDKEYTGYIELMR